MRKGCWRGIQCALCQPVITHLNTSLSGVACNSMLKRVKMTACALQTPLYLQSGAVLQQVFDLSYNRFTGSLPSFLSQQAVPSWTRSGIYLRVIALVPLLHHALPISSDSET